MQHSIKTLHPGSSSGLGLLSVKLVRIFKNKFMLWLHRSDFKVLFLKTLCFGEKKITEVVKSSNEVGDTWNTHHPLWIFLVTHSLIRWFTLTSSDPEFGWSSSRKQKGPSLRQLFLFDLIFCRSKDINTMYTMLANPNIKFWLLVAIFSLYNFQEKWIHAMEIRDSVSLPLGIILPNLKVW